MHCNNKMYALLKQHNFGIKSHTRTVDFVYYEGYILIMNNCYMKSNK